MNAEEFEVEKYEDKLEKLKSRAFGNALKSLFGTFIALFSLYGSIAFCYWYGSQCVFDTKLCPS